MADGENNNDNPPLIVPPDARPTVTEPSVSSVSLKIPPFWPADPQIWFAQVEAQFNTRGIRAEKTMFDYIVASLAPEFAQEVRDLILAPPTHTPYTTLKKQLISRTAASEQRRLQQLLHSEELGDRKPTQLLRRIEQLLGDKLHTIDAGFIRELFLQRLPSNVRMVLASSPDTNLQSLATLADKVMEVATPHSTISSVSTSPDSTIDSLRSEIADLRRLIEKHIRPKPSFHHRSRTPSRGPPSRGRSPTPAPPQSDEQSTLCWYHLHFGSNAQKCRPPCKYSGNDQASH